MSEETQPQTAVTETKPKPAMLVGQQGLNPADFDQMWRFATIVSKSGLAPKGIQTPEAIFVAVQMGMEVGLTPMSSLQNIAVINGRPSIWGDAQLGIVRGTGQLEVFQEHYILNGKRLELPDSTPRTPTPKELQDDTCAAVCVVKRKGYGISSGIFSVADAKQAKLMPADPSSPWTKYPARMLKFRARSFLLRDHFGDALKGIPQAEESMDMPIIEVDEVADTKPRRLGPSFKPVKRAQAATDVQDQPESATDADAVPAESGLSPQPVPEKVESTDIPGKPDPATTAPRTIQDDLAAECLKVTGCTFDTFLAVARAVGFITDKEAESIQCFGDVPANTARKLYGARITLAKNLSDAVAKGIV